MSANHISTVRQHLLDQMQALRSAEGIDAVKRELERSKGISELAQVAVNTAKVEVDYLVATEQTSTPFLEVPPDQTYLTDDKPRNGISSITQHRIKG